MRNVDANFFFDTQANQCAQCHRLQGRGQSVGPDLDSIGTKRSRQQLLESILDPSQQIEPPFKSYAVLTEDGRLVTGLKVKETKQQWVIRIASGKDERISKEEVASFKVQPQSLMPNGLAAGMTAQQLADLLEFLSSLK